jgi:hypothetical protein
LRIPRRIVHFPPGLIVPARAADDVTRQFSWPGYLKPARTAHITPLTADHPERGDVRPPV